MANTVKKSEICDNPIKSLSQEVDILRKAYELILENSNIFYDELGKAFMNAADNVEFDQTVYKI
jgi:hypothetical protein